MKLQTARGEVDTSGLTETSGQEDSPRYFDLAVVGAAASGHAGSVSSIQPHVVVATSGTPATSATGHSGVNLAIGSPTATAAFGGTRESRAIGTQSRTRSINDGG